MDDEKREKIKVLAAIVYDKQELYNAMLQLRSPSSERRKQQFIEQELLWADLLDAMRELERTKSE